ncbi:hypothetical protein GCM10020331_056070 [Ectobacillus funiculus]
MEFFSFYNLAIGLVMSIPALITGMIDFLAIPQEGTADRVAMRHMTVIITAITMFMGSFLYDLVLKFYLVGG